MFYVKEIKWLFMSDMIIMDFNQHEQIYSIIMILSHIGTPIQFDVYLDGNQRRKLVSSLLVSLLIANKNLVSKQLLSSSNDGILDDDFVVKLFPIHTQLLLLVPLLSNSNKTRALNYSNDNTEQKTLLKKIRNTYFERVQ